MGADDFSCVEQRVNHMNREQEAEIRASIEAEDEARQRVPERDLKPMHQNARHRRILLAEVERLRKVATP